MHECVWLCEYAHVYGDSINLLLKIHSFAINTNEINYACVFRGGNYNVLGSKQKYDNPLYGTTVTYQNPAMIPDFDTPTTVNQNNGHPRV